MANEKRLEGISDIRDESDRDGMRIVIELKRGETAEVVLNNLYKHSQLQVNFGVIMLSIVNGQPRELGILECLRKFIDHRIDVVRRRTDFLLRKAREREHLLLGFQKALNHLDLVIELIRAAKTPKDARAGLTGRRGCSDGAAADSCLTFAPDDRHRSRRVRLQRAPGSGHHRVATPAPDRHGAAEDPRRTRGNPADDRRVHGDPGLGNRSFAA
jgi:DNA gyrase/topoisomerase IV subunit A